MVIRDYVYVSGYGAEGVVMYVVEGYEEVFVKNVEDGRVVCVLRGHGVVPVIYWVEEAGVLVTGGLGDLRIWRIYQDLIGKFDEFPPWESNYCII